jgi:hypothetical protein
MSDIFKTIDFILKKKEEVTLEESGTTPYMLNRWLSMSDPSISIIVNSTTNKWITHRGICSQSLDNMSKFLKCVLPKYNKRIKYIKKAKSTSKENAQPSEMSYGEISSKEIKIYDEMLDFLNKSSKL